MKLEKEINLSIASKIDAFHEEKIEVLRSHMGVSGIGNECERAIWLSFRWVMKPKFSGRILRLFRRGHLEENNVIMDLKNIGIYVHDQQRRVNFNCHVSGSIDGLIKGGVPEAEKTEHLLEIKTYNDKRFLKLKKEGVQKSDPTYYTQCQVYMLGLGIDRALFYAVNKNTDEIHTERLHLDKDFAVKAVDRAKKIAISDRLPHPLSTDPTWYKCKMCNYHSFCHKTNLTENANCRTCAHITVKENNTMYCEKHEGEIPIDYQYEGCRDHFLHPDLVPWERDDEKYKINGEWIEGKSSLELLEGEVGKVKSVFSGKEVKSTPEGKRREEIGAEFKLIGEE